MPAGASTDQPARKGIAVATRPTLPISTRAKALAWATGLRRSYRSFFACSRSRSHDDGLTVPRWHRAVAPASRVGDYKRNSQTGVMLIDHWPFAGLRLNTDRLELRLPTDEELTQVALVAAGGVHQRDERPFLTPWTDLSPPERTVHVMKQHWSRRGDWSTAAWILELAVFLEQQPIGMVALRGREFSVLREVTTESWLGLDYHGSGLGTEARTALLYLAFAGLEADAALSEVFQNNPASQGVSRKLGYKHDGISRDVLDGRAVTSDRLRLTREVWDGRPHLKVTMNGLSPCLPLFGVTPGQRN